MQLKRSYRFARCSRTTCTAALRRCCVEAIWPERSRTRNFESTFIETRTSCLTMSRRPNPILRLHEAAIAIGNSFELIGGMVRNKIVPLEIFLPNYWWVVSNQWNNLEQYIAMMREYVDSPGLYVDFEYLTVLSRQWGEEHPDSYPRGASRIATKNLYPIADQPWFHQ